MSFLAKKIREQEFDPKLVGLLTNPFYIARRGLITALRKHRRYISGKVLDAGSGTKPYQDVFDTEQYIGLELDTSENRKNKTADHFYDGYRFPFEDESFDSVVSNQVLEHVRNPVQFLSENIRVLKKGGYILLTVPFTWEEHEKPNDFRRYSSFGLRKLLEEIGFEIIIQEKIGTGLDVVFQSLNNYLRKLAPRRRMLRFIFYICFMGSSNLLATLTSKILPNQGDMYLDNIVIAKK